jgi:hypothetical protein
MMRFDQPLCDRQAEPGAAIEPRRAGIGLTERLQGPL